MKEEIFLNIPTSKLEELRCFICKGYLSSSPIQLLPDGNCICGNCSSFDCNRAVTRVLQLEGILREVLFPCRFTKNGCAEKLPFDSTTDHESTCDYYMFTCPSLNFCSWRGLASQFYDHFGNKHPDLIKQNVGFKFDVGQTAEAVFIVIKENLFFIFKYYYSKNKKVLKYDLRCLKTKHEVVYNLQLINDSDSDCELILKSSKCFCFDSTFYEMQKAVTLNVNQLMEVLLGPTSIVVELKLRVFKNPCINKEEQLTKPILNYDLLELVRCSKCLKYLVFPLFRVIIGTVCYECSKSYKMALPSFNKKLKNLVATLNYPCQWYGCDFIGKSSEMKIHRLSCQFRSYKCCISFCCANLSLTSAASHLKKKHKNAEYSLHYAYKTSFLQPYEKKYAFTIKGNVLFIIRHSLTFNKFYREQEHSIFLFSDLSEITISIQFEHEHCKLKSKPFELVSNTTKIIKLNQLPSCFERDELSVIICEDQEDIIVKSKNKWWLFFVATILSVGFLILYCY